MYVCTYIHMKYGKTLDPPRDLRKNIQVYAYISTYPIKRCMLLCSVTLYRAMAVPCSVLLYCAFWLRDRVTCHGRPMGSPLLLRLGTLEPGNLLVQGQGYFSNAFSEIRSALNVYGTNE